MWKTLLNIDLVQASFRLMTPILLAALGAVYSTKSGITNIALEGMMLLGSFAAVVGSYFTQNAWIGLLIAAVTGGVFGAVLGLLSVKLKANHIVAGIAINIVASGLTIYMLRAMFNVRGSFQSEHIVGLPVITIPIINKIPVIGAIFGSGNPIFYIALFLVPISAVLLYKTAFGLRIRAVGENPQAAASVGINNAGIKYFCVILSGVFCGLAGAYLSIGHLTLFTEGMSSGRGWLGLSAMVFGSQTPVGAMLASWVFGLTDALQMRLQGIGLPSQFVQMIPYVIVLLTLMRIGAVKNKKDMLE